MGAPFAVFPTHAAAGVYDRAGVDPIAVKSLANVVGGVTQRLKVTAPDELHRLFATYSIAGGYDLLGYALYSF